MILDFYFSTARGTLFITFLSFTFYFETTQLWSKFSLDNWKESNQLLLFCFQSDGRARQIKSYLKLGTHKWVLNPFRWLQQRLKSTQNCEVIDVFWWEKPNGECNVKIFRRFLFGMSPCLPTGIQSPSSCKWLKILNWSKWILVISMLFLIFLTLLTSTVLLI